MGDIKRKKRVMVAIDEECSQYTLQWVLENLADTISASQLFIFHVEPNMPSYVYTCYLRYGAAKDLINTLKEKPPHKFALTLLEKAPNICANHGVDAETMTEVGDPRYKICEVVEKLNIELLILGSKNDPINLGKVTDYCVSTAKCNVLVVRKPACAD